MVAADARRQALSRLRFQTSISLDGLVAGPDQSEADLLAMAAWSFTGGCGR
ncbi:MAG: hypothetical protein QOF77_738 [Solirubrobacteraceae bacterium]|jgi:hypothetical protein|nr:hypothetical protein [Solirubrobacteraceae bacterium]